MSLRLSKSKYCNAVQCPKMLWLHRNKPEEFDDSVINEAVLETGNQVGDLAMGLFGDFTEVPFGDLGDMLEETQRLIDADTPVIAEASFALDGLFCSVDILKNKGNGHVEIYEVKSSTAVSEIYLHDTAYQQYVLSGLGYKVDGVYLVHINSCYVRHGEINLDELFVIEDVKCHTDALQYGIRDFLPELERIMESDYEPHREVGCHCNKPYTCGYFDYCTGRLSHPNVFDISRLKFDTKVKLFNEGDYDFESLAKRKEIKGNQRLQVESHLNNIGKIDAKGIRETVDSLSFPLYFLDFETFQEAIPPFDFTSPYEQIPFQYSLHCLESKNGELHHTEFLAEAGKDPRRALAEKLCNDIPYDVCTTAYNMGFEKNVIKKLAEVFPDLADHLMNIHDNIKDLMTPFSKKHYYLPAMQGSYSIKYVLPALYTNEPSLDYHNLEGIQKGDQASDAFKNMKSMTPEEIAETRKNLLAYCKLDTYAMVKVWQKLVENSK